MAVGYVSGGFLLLLPFMSTRFWFSLGGHALRTRGLLAAHRVVTYLSLLFLVVHIGGALLVDETVIEYLKPSAPWGMIAAILATIIMLTLIIQSEFRLALNMRYKRWYRWHGFLSSALIVGMFYHIYEARYFLSLPSEAIALGALCFASAVLIFFIESRYQPDDAKIASVPFSLTRLAVYSAAVATVAIFIYAIPAAGNRAERQALQCLISSC